MKRVVYYISDVGRCFSELLVLISLLIGKGVSSSSELGLNWVSNDIYP